MQDLAIREAAAVALETLGTDQALVAEKRPSTAELVAALGRGDPEIRAEACRQLGNRAEAGDTCGSAQRYNRRRPTSSLGCDALAC